MKMNRKLFFTTGIILVLTTLSCKSQNNVPKVVLYTGSSGGRTFSAVAQNYPDLTLVNFDNVARSCCIIGTWIFYGSKNYANFSNGVAAYSSKSNGCFTFQNLTENVSSFRFAGSGKDYKQDFIDLFSGIFFTGVHLSTSMAVSNLSSLRLPGTTSIIVSGTSPWTLYSNDSFVGRRKCVFPRAGQLPRFYRNTLDIGDILPKSIRKGCSL